MHFIYWLTPCCTHTYKESWTSNFSLVALKRLVHNSHTVMHITFITFLSLQIIVFILYFIFILMTNNLIALIDIHYMYTWDSTLCWVGITSDHKYSKQQLSHVRTNVHAKYSSQQLSHVRTNVIEEIICCCAMLLPNHYYTTRPSCPIMWIKTLHAKQYYLAWTLSFSFPYCMHDVTVSVSFVRSAESTRQLN